MTITFPSYNLKVAEKLIMQRCINDNPGCSYEDLSKLLGVSVRTVYRMVKGSDNLKALKDANSTLTKEASKEAYLVNRSLKRRRGKHAKQ